eukprot:GHVH01015978.1.p1 GENE.GHVH01015978.1~~GHVH01015978.1.p1  ORF type:complete len:194 (+),score=32.11 GHVH01015978.1:719-1300(+)
MSSVSSPDEVTGDDVEYLECIDDHRVPTRDPSKLNLAVEFVAQVRQSMESIAFAGLTLLDQAEQDASDRRPPQENNDGRQMKEPSVETRKKQSSSGEISSSSDLNRETSSLHVPEGSTPLLKELLTLPPSSSPFYAPSSRRSTTGYSPPPPGIDPTRFMSNLTPPYNPYASVGPRYGEFHSSLNQEYSRKSGI